VRGFAALVDPEAAGFGLTAFISVTLERPGDRGPFTELVQALGEVQECHHVAGDDDYRLKVRCRDTRHLERLVSDELKRLPGIIRTRTTISLSTVKETVKLPLAPSRAGE
jgi:Lrp/AsnC family leucine-responsive transcriptional regulator